MDLRFISVTQIQNSIWTPRIGVSKKLGIIGGNRRATKRDAVNAVGDAPPAAIHGGSLGEGGGITGATTGAIIGATRLLILEVLLVLLLFVFQFCAKIVCT